MRGITRLKRITRNIKRHFHPVVAVLMYHRVIDLPVDTYHLAVSPTNFSKHLEIIRKKYASIRLSELPKAMKTGSLPRRSVVITFDDGYCDNFSNALPLLEKYQVPATIFVVSGSVDSSREFWWDDLERIFLSSEHLPDEFVITVNGENHCLHFSTEEQRKETFLPLHRLIRKMPYEDRENIFKNLLGSAKLSPEGRPDHLPVKLNILKRAAQSKFIEIGAHTRTHPVLSAQNPEVQREEIIGSRLALETMLEQPIRTFAYPFGNAVDFSQQTAGIVRQAGFSTAVTTVQGVVEPGDDLYQLRRCQVDNWDADTFESRLDTFFKV